MIEPLLTQDLGSVFRDALLYSEDAPLPSPEILKLGKRAYDLLDDIRSELPEPSPDEHELVARLRFVVEWSGLDIDW